LRSEEGHEVSAARAPKRLVCTVRWVVGSLAIAVVLLVVAAAVISRTAGFRRFATSLLAGTVTKHMGRELTIGQLPVLRLGLTPALVAQDVALSGAAGTEQGETVRARRIELRARLLPLLRGHIVVERLVITGLDVLLDTTGKPASAEAPEAAAPAGGPPLTKGLSSLLSRLDVGEVLITDSSLALHDRASGRQTCVVVQHLRLARRLLAPTHLDADAEGTFNGIPIFLSGTLGGPAALVSATEPFPVDVVVGTAGGRVAVDGVIGRVWELKGVDLAVRAEVSDPAALGRGLGARLPGGGPWRVEGRVRDVGSGYSVAPLTVVFAANTVTGHVQLSGTGTASAKLAGSSLELRPLLTALGVKGGPSGRVGEFAAEVQTGGGTPREWVSNLAGRVHIGQGNLVAGERTRIEVERADVVSEVGGLGVEAVGSVAGVSLTVAGTVGSVETLAFGANPFPVDVVARTGATKVTVEGQLGSVSGTTLKLTGKGIELAPLLAVLGVKAGVSGRIGELAAEVQTRGRTPRDWVANLAGQVRVTQGSVVVGGGTRIEVERANLVTEAGLGVEVVGSAAGVPLTVAGTVGGFEELVFGGKPLPLDLVVKTDGATVGVEGRIGRVWSLGGVDVGVRAEVSDPVALGRVLGARLPGGGPWRVEGRVRDTGAGYALDPMRVALGGSTFAGSIRVEREAGASLKLAGESIELAPLLVALGVKAGVSGRVGEFAADVRTSGGTPKDWVVNLAGQVGATRGSVVVGGGTRVEVERANLMAEAGGLGVEAAGSLGGVPLSVAGTVGNVETLAFGGEPFPVDVVVKTDGGTAAIDGVIGRVWAFKNVDLGVRAEVSDPSALGRVLGVGLQGGGPWQVESRVRDTGAGYAVDPLAVAFAGNTVTGRVGIELEGARPTVTAELSSPLLDLSVFAAPAAPEEAPAAKAPSPTKEGPVFSSAPLSLHGLEAANGQVALWVQRLARGEHTEIGELTLRALLVDGSLVVEPIVLRTAGGTITGSVRLDASGTVSAKFAGDTIELGALLTELGGTGKSTGGATSLTVDLHSTGRSLHEWMANMGGGIRVVVGPGRLEGKKINLGLGMMTKVMELINPSQKEDQHTDLRCAVVSAAIEKGVVDLRNRVVIETTKFTAVGSGTVDLGREVLDVDVWAKASLSLSAGVSNFSGRVKVGGPLHKPSFTVNAKGAATTAVSVGGTVATGGLWLIGENLWTKIFTKAHCADALAGSTPTPGSAEAPQKP
jgi:uncharacterized protein involved in outer membrane biogenesis